ncbi:MAG: succinate--CoA ligase subunit beta [Sulfolobaceae archaeon]|nr:succinate--CoA ligase subunit beta [Sulfolobaceae archaeon]
MRLYEYEGKELFKMVGIKVPKGVITSEPIKWEGKAVVKSQLLEGARGKRGLVRVTDDVYNTILELKKLGIQKFLVEEYIPHSKELYLSALIDRDTGDPLIAASPEGGIDIESSTNVKTFRIPLERGVKTYDVIAIEKYLGVKGLEPFIKGLYSLVVDYNAELAEINPLAVLDNGNLVALDSKVILDDNALYLHEDLLKKFNRQEQVESLVELGGDIGIVGNGAGLTMATMDMVKLSGGNPADFYDIGGGAGREKVREALLKVASLPGVTRVFMNIYGGITRCDEVAIGIVNALNELEKQGKKIKVYVRLVGTNEEEGWRILKEHNIPVYQDFKTLLGEALRS